ncbi:MAG: rhodanese-like domain-containing protein [Candidatus Kapaibacterium sp.]
MTKGPSAKGFLSRLSFKEILEALSGRPNGCESEDIESDNLQVRLGSHERPVIIDVCEPFEYQKEHIRGAINIPMGFLEITMENNPFGVKKDDEIIVYCAHGIRSKQAARILKNMGYCNVKSLAGGISVYNSKSHY